MQMKFTWIIVLLFACSNQQKATNNVVDPPFKKEITETLRQQIMQEADWAMKQEPITVTAETSPRSGGGKHDFFSEGDYWWPNPVSADSPYIQKDGMTNPDNLVAHRNGMIRHSKIVSARASAYLVTNNEH